jgi:hypothetical protein
MLRLMNGLLRRVWCAGFVAASMLASLGAKAQESAAVESDGFQEGVAPASESEAMPLSAADQADQGVLPAQGAAPAGPLPSYPSSAPQQQQPGSTVDPTDPATYDPAAETDPAALNDFRDTLSPYGSWADDSTYGSVWVPSSGVVGADFSPYVTHGRWALGEDGGWVWVSDFSWGWAPFHYGRWVWIGGRGWSWIPGRVYSPAWVVWRTGYYDDYYVGWAPMPPTWYWRGGLAWSLWFVPPAPYVFCSSRHVFASGVRSYIVSPSRVGVIAPRTRAYVAASATVGGAPYRTAAFTRGPSMADAAQRVGPDPRAIAYSRPVANNSRFYAATAPRPAAGDYHQTWAGRNSLPTLRPGTGVAPRAPSSTTYSGFQSVPRSASPEVPRPLPSRSFAGPNAGMVRPSPAPYTAPTYRGAPPSSFRSSPSPTFRSAPSPTFRSAPSPSFRSAPSGGGPHFAPGPSAPRSFRGRGR